MVVHVFGSGQEAELAKSALESAGIASLISADTAGGMRPHPGMTGTGYRLLVREDDADAARQLIESRAGA